MIIAIVRNTLQYYQDTIVVHDIVIHTLKKYIDCKKKQKTGCGGKVLRAVFRVVNTLQSSFNDDEKKIAPPTSKIIKIKKQELKLKCKK